MTRKTPQKPSKQTLEEQAAAILKMAEQHGLESNYFFTTTFQRYQVQLQILDDLAEAIKEAGPLVTKTYVRDRENQYVNPAITEFNKTTDSANRTAGTLMRIIKTLRQEVDEEQDEFERF